MKPHPLARSPLPWWLYLSCPDALATSQAGKFNLWSNHLHPLQSSLGHSPTSQAVRCNRTGIPAMSQNVGGIPALCCKESLTSADFSSSIPVFEL